MRARWSLRQAVVVALSIGMLSSSVAAVGAPGVTELWAKLPPLQPRVSTPGEPVHVKPVPVSETDSKAVRDIPATSWPGNGQAEVDLAVPPSSDTQTRRKPGEGVAHQAAGNLPVSVGRVPSNSDRPGASSGGRVRVETFDQGTTARLGLAGVIVRVSDVSAAALSVQVDYSGFAHAYGADYGSRLRLVRYPTCALSAPAKPECRVATPIATDNNHRTRRVTGEVTLGSAQDAQSVTATSVLGVAAAPAGPGGTFKATDLAPSGSWSAGGSSGDFTYSYPLTVPPSPGGQAPTVSLGYSSGSLDGRTSSTNNQASSIGDGWDVGASGFIERRYKPCAEDLGGNQGQTKTGDLCWATDNGTMMLGGTSTEIVKDAGNGVWRPKEDDGSRIERLADTGRGNGDDNGEYWKVTTTDGTQYFLGMNRLPGWAAGKPETRSTWTVPVYGNHGLEPCNKTGFAESSCPQAWRWNLDYRVDPNGNAVTYYYSPETNYYGRNLTASAATAYVRGGLLDRIEYGLRSDNLFAPAPAKITFTPAERCLPSGQITCDPAQLNAGTASSWPDVPFDQICNAGQSCDNRYSPTFFSRKRIAKITTKILRDDTGTTPTWRDVDSWDLRHQFPASGDGLAPALWLAGITRTGLSNGSVALPELQFGGTSKENRVDAVDDRPPITRYRVTGIRSEAGAYTTIQYAEPDCIAGSRMPANPESNTMRCYPSWWTPEHGTEPVRDYFHKYVVVYVTEDQRTTGADVPLKTYFQYPAGAAWHFDENELAKPEHRSWSEWRGYGKVRTIKGDPSAIQSVTETRFLRGMDGDTLPGGGRRDVWVVDSDGGRIEDHEALQGYNRETLQENGGVVVSVAVNDPWIHGPTASNGTDRAYLTDVATVRGRTLLDGGTWRQTKVSTTFNEHGIVDKVDDAGDLAVTGDETCTRTTYARNDGALMLSYPSRVHTVSLPCSAGTGGNADHISDVRSLYDGQAYGAAPTRGNVTAAERWTGSAYQTVTRSTYDAYGRVTEAFDAANRKTSTGYTPASGYPVRTVVTTNPKSFVTTSKVDPARGVPVGEIGPNNETTTLSYDGLGRLWKAWLPGRASTSSPNIEFGYEYRTNAPTVVTTKSLRENGTYGVGYVLLDGLLRQRQTQNPASGGGRLIADTLYDTRGLPWKKNGAYYNTSAPATAIHGVLDESVPNQTVTEFDGLGRPTSVIYRNRNVEQWRTRTTHSGDREKITPPAGGTPTTVIEDAQGRPVERRLHNGSVNGTNYDATTYGYTKAGQLAWVRDPMGNTWRYEYDVLGRKVRDEDPDKGATTYGYNDLDQLISTTDARNKTLAYTYDELGRKTGLFEGSPTGTKLAEWTFDTLKKGLPTASTRFVGGSAYTSRVTWYDEANRPTRSEVVIPPAEGSLLANTYKFSASYTPNTGLLASATMPAAGGLNAEAVFHEYNDFGLPTKTYGFETYAQEHLYSEYGETLRLTYGDGARVAWLTNEYQSGSRRLERSIVDRNAEPGFVVSDRMYSYDPAGNIKSIVDVPEGAPADAQCFGYDYLRRLTRAWTPASRSCVTAASVSGLGGAAPYWLDFGYDKTGNRTSEVTHTTQGDTTRTFEYPAAGQPQPHTARAVSQSGAAGSARDEFGYDPVGATASRRVAGKTQTLEYDAEGRVGTVTEADGKTSTYVYDADGQRLVKREPGRTTLSLPGMELVAANGAVTARRYYTHGGATVAVRTPSGVSLLMSDHQGTVSTTVAMAPGLAVGRRYHDPFGTPRGPAPVAWPDEKGFVGGTKDATGLTHVGARQLDPATGRFTSVDPIMDVADPQQMHGYSYANNTPVTQSDPTGLRPAGCEEFHLNCRTDSTHMSPIPAEQARHEGTQRRVAHEANQRYQNQKKPKPRPWAGDMDRVKKKLAEKYNRSNFDDMVAPDGLPEHLRESALDELQEQLCGIFPDNCLDIGLELAAGAVWIASPKGLTAHKWESADIVRSATAGVLSTQTNAQILAENLSQAEMDALRDNRGMARMFFGQALHRAVANALDASPDTRGRFQYNPNRDVDFYDTRTRARVELTTGGQVTPHILRGGNYPGAAYVAYNVNIYVNGPGMR